MHEQWRDLLKECLLDPKDIKEDNALNVFKMLYTHTKNIYPTYALICAKEAITLACREAEDNDVLSDFGINLLIFKTNTVRFIQEDLGNPVPK